MADTATEVEENKKEFVSRYQRLEREGVAFGSHLVAMGTGKHAREILVVSAGSIAALLPAALLPMGPGLEILSPLALVMIGGLVTTSLVLLYVVPSLYLMFGARSAQVESELFPEGSRHDVP